MWERRPCDNGDRHMRPHHHHILIVTFPSHVLCELLHHRGRHLLVLQAVQEEVHVRLRLRAAQRRADAATRDDAGLANQLRQVVQDAAGGLVKENLELFWAARDRKLAFDVLPGHCLLRLLQAQHCARGVPHAARLRLRERLRGVVHIQQAHKGVLALRGWHVQQAYHRAPLLQCLDILRRQHRGLVADVAHAYQARELEVLRVVGHLAPQLHVLLAAGHEEAIAQEVEDVFKDGTVAVDKVGAVLICPPAVQQHPERGGYRQSVPCRPVARVTHKQRDRSLAAAGGRQAGVLALRGHCSCLLGNQ
mmetsp:Transcript_18716/g.47972  ORF Transcript_18716/g.47972 Transcript_18716/m.47972 type:complete len:306 (-) Transcript_18716:127-1044(-)